MIEKEIVRNIMDDEWKNMIYFSRISLKNEMINEYFVLCNNISEYMNLRNYITIWVEVLEYANLNILKLINNKK
ncbi:hypothetical protein, partial [Armatimonas sp.]|uniref:hypothetical protein n=1 Tax=Armatimonas sp. TaxID=1872638 RepID=UPI00286B27F6